MIIKALILSTLLTSDSAIVVMPPDKIEARRRYNKGKRDHRRGGGGLR